jgi:hypothetical protein
LTGPSLAATIRAATDPHSLPWELLRVPCPDFVELVIEPLFDVVPPEAHMSTDAESGGTFVSVSPRVDGGDRHPEVVGEFLDGEKPI